MNYKEFAEDVLAKEHPDLKYDIRIRVKNWPAGNYRGCQYPTKKKITISFGQGTKDSHIKGLILHEIAHIETQGEKIPVGNKVMSIFKYGRQRTRRVVHGDAFWKKAFRLFREYNIPQSFIKNEIKYRANASNYNKE